MAVMGVNDEWKGEVPKAYVVLKPGVEEGVGVGREILRFVREKKVRYKWVDQIEFVSCAIPAARLGYGVVLLTRCLDRRDPQIPLGQDPKARVARQGEGGEVWVGGSRRSKSEVITSTQ